MRNLAEFSWMILGSKDDQIPNSPVAAGEVEMSLYDSGYNYDVLRAAVKKDVNAPEDFRKNLRKILDGEGCLWKLWLVTVYANRIAFDYCHKEGDLYHIELNAPRLLGLRFVARPFIDGRQTEYVTTCLIWGDARVGSCRTQIEEFQDGRMTASFNLYYSGEKSRRKKLK